MNLEPIRALLELVKKNKALVESGAPMCLRDANAAHIFTIVVEGAPALSQLLEAVTWQPIETAPKDGTEILVREKCGRIRVACWCDPDAYKANWYVQVSESGHDPYPTTDVIEWLPLSPPEDKQ